MFVRAVVVFVVFIALTSAIPHHNHGQKAHHPAPHKLHKHNQNHVKPNHKSQPIHHPSNPQRDLEQQTSDSCDHVSRQIGLVPIPRSLSFHKGCFNIDNNTPIVCDHANLANAHHIAALLRIPQSRIVQKDGVGSDQAGVVLAIEHSSHGIGPEGYEMQITNKGIRIHAETAAGVFHGVMTVRQLLSPEFEHNSHNAPIALPWVDIVDWPVYSWRGMHLDVSRHFFDATFVKKFIDLMALHKMNRFHWHLTDDQGWRIPIAKYPNLVEIGAWRSEGWGQRYGGAYTREEIASVIEYAGERHITVVPEIEMPGHAQAAVASYPELGCPHHSPPQVWNDWGVSQETFCAGNNKTIQFLQDVLVDVMQLFPSTYIHVGGDECDKNHWRSCEVCQNHMAEHHLHSPEQLQAHFTSHMSHFLAQYGRRLVGWDEILEGGLDSGATVMSWRGIDGGIEAARRGLDAIMTPQDFVYFDRSYSPYDRLGRFGTLPLRKTYEWEPLPSGMDQNTKSHVLGGQGNVWTEGIVTEKDVEYLSVPRISALAEVLWSPAQARNWQGFCRRLKGLQSRFQALDIEYYEDPSVTAAAVQNMDLERDNSAPSHHHFTSHPQPQIRSISPIEHNLKRTKQWFANMFDRDGSPV